MENNLPPIACLDAVNDGTNTLTFEVGTEGVIAITQDGATFTILYDDGTVKQLVNVPCVVTRQWPSQKK